MELDVIKSQTTWNDASQSINLNFAKIRQALASIGSGGGTVDALISTVYDVSNFGSISTNDNSATFNAFAIDSLYKRIKILEDEEVDFTGYATEQWVLNKSYITAAALSPYLKTSDANSTFATLVAFNALSNKTNALEGGLETLQSNHSDLSNEVESLDDNLGTLSSNFNTLKGRFDALDDALNDDVSGKINTWNEIVDFLDEYNGSKDLATILSGMNADIALRLKTADFDAWKTDVYSPLATRVSTAEDNISTHTTQISGLTSRMGSAETNISTNAKGIADNKTAIATNKNNISANATAISNNAKAISANATAINNNATAITNLGKRVTANEGNIAEILKWFAVDADGNLYTTYNLYSTKEISANGLSVGTGGGGGGLISQVFGTTAFGTIASESNSATFNAYAIDSLYKRIVSLEGKATAVSFTPSLTSGKQIGTLSIDGVSTVLYGVDAYSKADADSTFLKLSGGEINGYLDISHATQSIALGVKSKSTDYVAIRFTGANGNSAYLVYSGNGDEWAVTPPNWAGSRILLHSNNYSQYALPLTGGTINGGAGALEIKRNGPYLSNIKFSNTDGELGKLGFVWANNPAFFHTDGNYYPLYHTGNFNPADYLPLTGGSIVSSTIGCPLYLANTKEDWNTIGFKGKSHDTYAYLGLNKDGNFFVTTTGWTAAYGLIHSGNIGSQSVASANKLVTASGSNYAYHSDSSKYTVFGISGYNCYIDGVTTYFRYGANSTIGMIINSSGNVTIGTSDLAGTDYKLVVNGLSRFKNNVESDGNVIGAGAVQAKTTAHGFVSLQVGSTGNKGLLDSRTSWILYTNGTNTFLPQGSVGIGTTSPAYKLDVNGSVGIGSSGASDLVLRRTNGFSYITAASHLALSTKGDAANVAIAVLDNKNAVFYGNVGIGSSSPGHKLDVNGDIASSGSLLMGLNSAYGAYLQTNEEGGWTGIYSANKGNWQASNMYIMPDGDVRFAHAARVIGKNTNGDTGLFVEGTQYSIWFGIGSGNVNRGIFDINNNGWWIYRGSDTLTRISGGIETSTGSFTGALTVATNVQIPINGDRITFCSATGTYTKGILAMNTSNTYLEAPLATDSASGAKPAILIGWRGCSAATGTTKPYPITITSGGIALNGAVTTDSSLNVGTVINVGSNIMPKTTETSYLGSTSLRFLAVCAKIGDFSGAVTMYSTLRVVDVSTFESYLNIQAGIRPNADNARYVGTSSYRFNEGYINNMYTNAVYVGKGTTYGFKSDGSINATAITANSGVKVASGQALTFLDASGKEHKLTYDSTAGAFKFDGNILVLGDGQFNAIN